MIKREVRELNLKLVDAFPHTFSGKYGDYRISHKKRVILIERKTMTDALGSWFSGRLDKQVSGCDALLIEGTYVPRKLKRKVFHLRKHLNTLSFLIPVVYTDGVPGTIRELKRIESKLKDGELGVLRCPERVVKNKDTRIPVLMGFVGISEYRARDIILRYKSLKKALANIHNWHKVKSIGESVKKKVLEEWVRQ